MVQPSFTAEVNALDHLLEPLRLCLSRELAERLTGLRADAITQARLDQLAERHAEGQLTPEELAEYDGYVRAGNLIAVLQAKAQSVLDASA